MLQDAETSAATHPIAFALKRNLQVEVKLAKVACCCGSAANKFASTASVASAATTSTSVWCFASRGMKNVAQDELLIAIEDVHDNDFNAFLPSFLDVLRYFDALYEDVLKGKPLSDMTYGIAPAPASPSTTGNNSKSSDQSGNSGGSTSFITTATDSVGFLGSKDNAGFLHFRPAGQCCLKSLCLPEDPFLVGLLIQKTELPWAKVLPLRLALQLGSENSPYPWPIISQPRRKPTISDQPGHTIMNLLNDFRNFTYTILHVSRAWVTMDGERTTISLPIDQFHQVQKLLQTSNEHVLAFATSFCKKADSHLVCVQQPETGLYTTKTVNKENTATTIGGPNKLSGGTFVIINASLKATGPAVRASIVEDGVMIQVKPDIMQMIRDKLEKREDLSIENDPEKTTTIGGGSSPPANNDDQDDQCPSCTVEIVWQNVHACHLRIASAVDGQDLSGAARFRLYGKNVEVSNSANLIRLISLFLLPNDDGTAVGEPDDLHNAVKRISIAVASALLPYSSKLNAQNIGIRFTLGLDMVEYVVGLDGRPLPEDLSPLMDDYLIPVINNAVNENSNRNLTKVELLLRLLKL